MGATASVLGNKYPARYRIVVRGAVCEPLVGPLAEMSVDVSGGESVLTGELADQSQLQGVLMALGRLGIELISVNPVP